MVFADTHNNPWMVERDFNVMESLFKISGGHAQPRAALNAFNLALLDCGLEDVGFVGSPLTCTNGYPWKCLDRVVFNFL